MSDLRDDEERAGEAEGPDLDARELCPDGGCIGVIGDDGRCRVCGLASEGAGSPSLAARADSPAGADSHAPLSSVGDDAQADDFDARTLCPDGACIGLVGDDGRCKVCGRSAA